MKNYYFVFTALLYCLLSSSQLSAQNNLLGKIDFPNSGSEEAQADFIEGVKFLHNFEYADAARAFRRAQQIDPDFALAYWGEAKTHNHAIWMEQNRAAALTILNRLGSTVEARQSKAPTQREKDYLLSIETLYGNTPESQGKSKQERDFLYMNMMRNLHETYPEDHEIIAFYGLSILGTAHDGRDFAIYMRAAAELFDVWNANQEHPGAAHYLIHSFDDPTHAPLGLPMARAYSKIAPSAAHAQHMTSHIFLALGMWDDVISANIVARDVQTARQKELGNPTSVCGHYTWWLLYGYMQTGDENGANQVFQTCTERVQSSPTGGERWHYSLMLSHKIIDSENWAAWDSNTLSYEGSPAGGVNFFFTSAFVALKRGDLPMAESYIQKLVNASTSEPVSKNIQVKQLQAMVLIEKGDVEQGIATLKEAVEEEFALPIDFGPPTIVKPSSELLGEVFEKLGRMEEAKKAYEDQLVRTPERRLSLKGLVGKN